MIKALYIVVAVLVLLPSFVAGVMTLYVSHHAQKMARETPREPEDTVYVMTDTLTFTPGKAEIAIYPRAWAAVLVIVGCAAWVIGVVVLLFVRHA